MNKQKIKDFVQEHKTEIVIGVVCGCIGVHYGKKKFGVSADEMKLVKELKRFDVIKGNNDMINDIYEIQKGSTRATVFRPSVTQHFADISDIVKDYVECCGKNPETTGFVVFTK